jgi:hypothetical protein
MCTSESEARWRAAIEDLCEAGVKLVLGELERTPVLA